MPVGIPEYYLSATYQTVGVVQSIWLEREGVDDAIKFRLSVQYVDSTGRHEAQPRFFRKITASSVVAISQMNLLRDAVEPQKFPLLAHVHFLRNEDFDEWFEVTWVRLVSGYEYGTTINEFFGYERTERFYVEYRP